MGQESSFCRDVLGGIRIYAMHRKPWVFRNGPPRLEMIRPLREWKPHGIIAHLFDEQVARAVLRLRRPVVDIACTLPKLKIPTVDVDHTAVGRMAAEHFLDRGFRRFGFFGSSRARYAIAREASFRQRLAEAGFEVSSCHVEYVPQLPTAASWRRIDNQVLRWLKRLPKPVAVLASNDVPARDLTDMCRRLALRVPDNVAVLGIDNDEVECGLSSPPLSSVAIPMERIGCAAAELLDRLMAGKAAPTETVFLPPVRVVARQSTDMLAIDNPAVSAALSYIRKHAAEGVSVRATVNRTAQGRRSLECRFRDLVGRTMLQEIHRVQVEIAKGLLAETNLAMPAIARRAGFVNAARLCVVFRRVTGLPPTAYRQRSMIRNRPIYPRRVS